MKKNAVGRLIVRGYWLAFFTLLIIAFFSYYSSYQLRSSGIAVAHSNKVLFTLSEFELTATEMESAVRGFMIFPSAKLKNTVIADETYLQQLLTNLKGILRLNEKQLKHLEILDQNVDEFSRQSRTLVSLREIQGPEAAQAYYASAESEQKMAELKLQIRQMQEMESTQLLTREAMREDLIISFNWLYISLLSSVFIVITILYYYIIQSIRNKTNS